MKQLSIVLVFAFAIFSIPSFANNSNDAGKLLFKVKTVQEKVISVRLVNLQQQATKITIKSLSGKLYFEDSVRKHNGYFKNLNLEQLPQGKYTVKVKNGSTEVVKVMVVKANDIYLSQSASI